MCIKAFLVSVSDYSYSGYNNLPYCKNDMYQLQHALIQGLKVTPDNITLLGEDGTLPKCYFEFEFNSFLNSCKEDDIVIFYFSGHGAPGELVFSDDRIKIDSVISQINNCNSQRKIIIFDSCHSGGFTFDQLAQLDSETDLENFIGHGCAIMASCSASQTSGPHPRRDMSLYTSFLCDALKDKFIIREGKKSLEAINETIGLYSKVWNERNENDKIQYPIFRSNIGGTLFFKVSDYKPYPQKTIFEETDKYIIYEVEPSHNAQAKRYAVKVLLKRPCTFEDISDITKEIINKAIRYEVYSNEISKIHYFGKPANIVWCYYGNDEEDMANCNYICHTTWVDDSQDKLHWYGVRKNSLTINGIYIENNPYYELIKEIQKCDLDKEEYIQVTKEYFTNLINTAEKFIQCFREYQNKTFSRDYQDAFFPEHIFSSSIQPLNKDFEKWYNKLTELPCPPIEISKWANDILLIACTIDDLSLFYKKENINTWTRENKLFLIKSTIKRYEQELEAIKNNYPEM